MKEERIMYAEYSKAIKVTSAVRGINSHIILSRAWKISILGFTRLVIKEGLLYMNMPINSDAAAEASTIKDISSTLCPIEVRYMTNKPLVSEMYAPANAASKTKIHLNLNRPCASKQSTLDLF